MKGQNGSGCSLRFPAKMRLFDNAMFARVLYLVLLCSLRIC